MRFLLVMVLTAVCAVPAAAVQVVSKDAGPALNGDARMEGKTLVLTPDAAWLAGSYFPWRIEMPVFDVSFSFKLSPAANPEADGITFCIHNDPRGDKAIGAKGGYLGYGYSEYWGVRGIENSIAIEFDNYYNPEFCDPEGDHVGININGSVASAKWALLPFQLEGQMIHARVTYDGRAIEVQVGLPSEKSNMPKVVSECRLRYEVDIMPILKAGTVYAGFTGATATFYQKQEVFCPWGLDEAPKTASGGKIHYVADL